MSNQEKLIKAYECLSTIPFVGSDNAKKMAGVFSVLEEVINDMNINKPTDNLNKKEKGVE